MQTMWYVTIAARLFDIKQQICTGCLQQGKVWGACEQTKKKDAEALIWQHTSLYVDPFQVLTHVKLLQSHTGKRLGAQRSKYLLAQTCTSKVQQVCCRQ